MPDPIVMAQAAGLAAIIAAVLAWLVGRFGWPGGALAVGAGILAGVWVLGLVPRVPPREALDRFLLLLVPAAVLAETLAATTSRTRWVGWGLRLVVAALAVPVLVHGSSYVTDLSGPGSREWTTDQTVTTYVGLAVALVLMQSLLSLLASRAGRSTSVAVAVASAGAAVTVMLSGYATGGQLAIPLATAVGAFAVLGSRHAAGAVAVAVIALFTLLVVSKLFAGQTTHNAVVLFAAPLLAWVPEIPLLRRLGPRIRGVLPAILTSIPVILTLWIAQQKFAADSAAPGTAPGEPSLNDYMNFGKDLKDK
jgi:hypothetical protein